MPVAPLTDVLRRTRRAQAHLDVARQAHARRVAENGGPGMLDLLGMAALITVFLAAAVLA